MLQFTPKSSIGVTAKVSISTSQQHSFHYDDVYKFFIAYNINNHMYGYNYWKY